MGLPDVPKPKMSSRFIMRGHDRRRRGGQGSGRSGGRDPNVSHQAALAVVPPVELWGDIQDIRRAHDKAFRRWPPHVNVLYPFLNVSHFDDAAGAAHTALTCVAPFDVTLGMFGSFPHGAVWLDPVASSSAEEAGTSRAHAEADPWYRLHAALLGTPFFSSSGDGRPRFVPHMSVGQWPKANVREAATALSAVWSSTGAEGVEGTRPVPSFRCNQVCLLWRDGPDAPFHLRATVPLGGVGAPVTGMNAVYSADKGCWVEATGSSRCDGDGEPLARTHLATSSGLQS